MDKKERLDKFRKLVEEASKDPLPEEEFRWRVEKQEVTRQGRIVVEDPEELRALMELSDVYCPIKKEYIDEQVEHEKQHVEEAKRIYGNLGDKVKYFYAFQFLQMEDGSLGSVPLFEVYLPDDVSEEEIKKSSMQIVKAPVNRSEGDREYIKSNHES